MVDGLNVELMFSCIKMFNCWTSWRRITYRKFGSHKREPL